MEDRFEQIEADNIIFQNLKNINWKIDKKKLKFAQKKRTLKLQNIFKRMMYGENIEEIQQDVDFQNGIQSKKQSKFSRMLSRSETKILNKQQTQKLNKLVSNSLVKDQTEPQNDFQSKINLDNFGIETKQLQEFFFSLKNNKTIINQVGFFVKLLHLPQYAQELDTLKQIGFNTTCTEEPKQTQEYPINSIMISPSEEALNMSYDQILQFSENDKILKFFIYKNSEDRFFETWKQKFVEEKYEFFTSFKQVIERVFHYCRYTKFIQNEDQLNQIIGLSQEEKKDFSCFCPKHLKDISECGTLYCLETIFKNYKDQFNNQRKLEQEIHYMNKLLTSSLDYNIKTQNILNMFQQVSPLFQLFNTILKMNNIAFLNTVEPVLNLMMNKFKVQDNIQQEQKQQYYICINAPLTLINKIKSDYVKNQCYYFSEFVYASSNREELIKCLPNLMITIQIQDDYIYKTNSLFMMNQNTIKPLTFLNQPLKDNLSSQEPQSNQNLAFGLNRNWSTEEILIPAHYPFRVKSFNMVNDMYELILQLPNQFDYIDEHFLLFSQPLLIQSQQPTQEVDELLTQYSIKILEELIPLKNQNPSFYMELFFHKQLYKNYQYYKKEHFEETTYQQNDDVVQNAILQHNQFLVEEKGLKEFESLYQMCSYLKKNHFLNQVSTIIYTLCIRNDINQANKKAYQKIYLIGSEKSFFCQEELDNVFQTCDSAMLRQFFESLVNTKQIYINFNGHFIKQKQLVQNGLKILNIIKDLNNIEVLYFDINENLYVLSILKSFLQKYENLRTLKKLIILIEKCQMYDSDFLNLAIVNTFTQLETLAISCNSNKLTNNCVSTLLTFSKNNSLKNLYLKLNDNKIDDKNLRSLKSKLENDKLKVAVDLEE